MAGLGAGGTLGAAGVGDAIVSHHAGITPGSSHPWLADTLTSHIITVLVLGAHGVTVTLAAALARVDTPVIILALVTLPSLHIRQTPEMCICVLV